MGKNPEVKRLAFALLPTILIAGLLLGGCSSYKGFVYQPNPPIAEKPRVPFNIVVLPFEDGTPAWKTSAGIPGQDNFTKSPMVFNISDGQQRDKLPPFIPPERWAREFAKEMTTSGAFASVRYAEDGRNPEGDILIRGKVLCASMSGFGFYDYSVQLQAVQYGDGKALWGKTVSRQIRSMTGNPVDVTQTLWRSMFGEALTDLVKELESRRAEWGAIRGEPAVPASETGESVEEILRKINKQ